MSARLGGGPLRLTPAVLAGTTVTGLGLVLTAAVPRGVAAQTTVRRPTTATPTARDTTVRPPSGTATGMAASARSPA